MQYNDIKPYNWYIKQDRSYCDSTNEHQIYCILNIYFNRRNVNSFNKTLSFTESENIAMPQANGKKVFKANT